MSAPNIGIGRIAIPYTVSGLTHVSRMYVTGLALVGSTWEIDVRPTPGGAIDWADAAESLANAMSSMLATGVTPGTALLEEYSSTGWLPRATAAVTFPNLSGSTATASQLTLTLRDTAFKRPKFVLMEVNNPGPLKFTNPTAGGANLDAFFAEFLNVGVTANRPWFVMTNMHESYLQEEPFVSATITYNRKLRRARGLA
jgi:cytosine/adenosine deaminase-related metal-dependent hydrolase